MPIEVAEFEDRAPGDRREPALAIPGTDLVGLLSRFESDGTVRQRGRDVANPPEDDSEYGSP